MDEWRPHATHMPEGVPLETKPGGRHLVRRGNLFYDPKERVFVYYTPTEWRYPK